MCKMEAAMQRLEWGGGNVLSTVWKDHKVGKRIQEMTESHCGWNRVSPETKVKIKMDVDQESHSWSLVGLKFLRSRSIYLWETRTNSVFCYEHKGNCWRALCCDESWSNLYGKKMTFVKRSKLCINNTGRRIEDILVN